MDWRHDFPPSWHVLQCTRSRPLGMETERTIAEQIRDFQEKLLHSFRMREKGWQTIKKAGVSAFLEQLAQLYEIIVYSDYSYMHVDPVMPAMERLDTKHCVTYKLGKAATMYQIAEESYTTQTATLETAMSTPVFVQGSLNSVCNLYQLLIWAVLYTANEDLESITDTQTELQLMELNAHNFVKFKVQNNTTPMDHCRKKASSFFTLEDKVVL